MQDEILMQDEIRAMICRLIVFMGSSHDLLAKLAEFDGGDPRTLAAAEAVRRLGEQLIELYAISPEEIASMVELYD